jgi:hypothetical protein
LQQNRPKKVIDETSFERLGCGDGVEKVDVACGLKS